MRHSRSAIPRRLRDQLVGELAQRHRLELEEVRALSLRQQQQLLDEAVHPVELAGDQGDRLAPVVLVAEVALGEQLEVPARDRDRRSQLVADVADELALARERDRQSIEHPVERFAELCDLVVATRPGSADPSAVPETERAASRSSLSGSSTRPTIEKATHRAEQQHDPGDHGDDPHRLVEWRKWRRPVNTIATPAASQAATTSASRFEPPGWMSAVAPASIAVCGPSGKGKKASEATTDPASSAVAPRRRTRRAPCRSRSAPSRPGSSARRRSRPSPRRVANTIAFERTCRQTVQANSRSSHCSSVGCGLGRHGHRLARLVDPVGVLDQQAAAHALDVALARRVVELLGSTSRIRIDSFWVSISIAPVVEAGREQHLDELLVEPLGERPVDRAVEDAARRRTPRRGSQAKARS